MPKANSLRSDLTGSRLRALVRQFKDAGQARHLLALAVIYDCGSRTEAARNGDVTLQITGDWVLRFNAQGPAGPITQARRLVLTATWNTVPTRTSKAWCPGG